MSNERWDRMSQTLADAGFPNKVSGLNYAGGKSYRIVFKLDPTHVVVVHDKWWKKNPDIWVGWSAYVENTKTALAVRDSGWAATKKRGVIRDFILAVKGESERGELR